jgi:hypothetical protein
MSKSRKTVHKNAQIKADKRRKNNEIICKYHKKQGNTKFICFKLIKKKQVEENGTGIRNGVAGNVTDIVLSSIESEKKIDPEIWIVDSGALRELRIGKRKLTTQFRN